MATTGGAPLRADDDNAIAEQKRLALTYLGEAWDGALAQGVAAEIFAHAALFTALADLIATYGEDAVADFVRTLPRRVQALEFSVDRSVQ